MSVDTQKLLGLFDAAAQAHGWASDQGTRVQAQAALANYQRTRKDLEQALDTQAAEIARLQLQWLPIEDAPRGIEVLVWREDSGPFIAKLTTPDDVITPEEIEREGLEFPDDFEEWFSDAYGWQEGAERPTHWMPLPAEPCAALSGESNGQ